MEGVWDFSVMAEDKIEEQKYMKKKKAFYKNLKDKVDVFQKKIKSKKGKGEYAELQNNVYEKARLIGQTYKHIEDNFFEPESDDT